MEDDEFLTLEQSGHAQHRVSGSRFLATAHPLAGLQDLTLRLTAERQRYHDASHWCFAARVGVATELAERFSDAGEPPGTAGRPILKEIRRRNLTYCAVVVTRFFGGTKLGTGNLARAYAESAALALDRAVTVCRRIWIRLRVTCPFDDQGTVYHQAAKLDSVVAAVPPSAAQASLEVHAPRRHVDALRERLANESAGRIAVEEIGTWIS